MKLKSAAICLFLYLTAFYHPLEAVAIDVTLCKNEEDIPIQEEFLELSNFHPHTIYILHLEGVQHVLPLSDLPFITVTDHNTILIENEEQLTDKNSVLFQLEPNGNRPHLTILKIPTDCYPNLGNERWGSYINRVKDWLNPGKVTTQLLEMTQAQPLKHVLTIGCGTGREALYWVDHGSHVTILDGTPHAVAITSLRLADKKALPFLKEALICLVESIPDELGTFDAVTGSALFPFIPPQSFDEVMTHKVLSHVVPGGYFAADFFGLKHSWAQDSTMTFVSLEYLLDLFERANFEVIWQEESQEMRETVFEGTIPWHEIKIIAKRKA